MADTTEWSQIEPTGFGLSPFGDPDTDKTLSIHSRGFGDPPTNWDEYTGD